jgi:cell wall-associated NlpC family hydrolase
MLSPAELEPFIGVPYRPHGRGSSGMDCYGLILAIAGLLGKPLPDVWYEGHDLSLMSLASAMNVKKLDKPEPGCILEMEHRGRLHLGYAIDKERMIHATLCGVCVDPIGTIKIRGYYGFG